MNRIRRALVAVSLTAISPVLAGRSINLRSKQFGVERTTRQRCESAGDVTLVCCGTVPAAQSSDLCPRRNGSNFWKAADTAET